MPGKSKKGGGLEVGSAYKMKYQGNNSAFPFKSPMKQGFGYKKKGLDIAKLGGIFETEQTFTSSKDRPKHYATTSFTPSIKLSDKFRLGLSQSGSSEGNIAIPTTKGHSQTSATGKLKFGGGTGRHKLHTGFQGSLSGDIGVRNLFSKKGSGDYGKTKGKLAYGGKLSLGMGSKKHSIKAFGEHASKYHISGSGTKVGIEGKTGIFKGSIGYNIKTKKPEFKLGINI